jgi:hypothetical protein
MLKRIRKQLPIVAGIVAILALYGLVGETPDERETSTAYVEETIKAARQESLVKNDERKTQMDWAEQFTPPVVVHQLAQADQ